VKEIALGQDIFVQILHLSPVIIISPMAHIHLSIIDRYITQKSTASINN